ncbi:MAG: DNA polymerase III subunit gamma/tau, partial [Xanthomonadales bacterium]|nr:DNA polymerase III subunit gamma/tau [Xanthomonadales bacterium]
ASPSVGVAPAAAAPVATGGDGPPDWERLIERAELRGPLGLLAQNAVLRAREGQTLVLALQPLHLHMAVEPMVSQMEERLSQALGEAIHLHFVPLANAATAARTPAARAAQARDAAQVAAEQAITADPVVQALQREFGARVVPQSIQPIADGAESA